MLPDETPLDLASPRWRELAQAYGSAEDIPRLIEHLARVGEGERRELWFGLWSTLCPAGEPFDAAYAAVPHLVAFVQVGHRSQAAAETARALHLVGAVELGRVLPGAAPVPADLVAAYRAAIAGVPAAIAGVMGERWDDDTTQILVSVLAVAKGHLRLGNATLQLEDTTSCPACAATFPTPGWRRDADD